MLDILDILAVREAVALQPPRRRVICEMVMEDYTLAEIRKKLDMSWGTLGTHMARLRESFVEIGFGNSRRRRMAGPHRSRTQGPVPARVSVACSQRCA